ncbi:photosystem reaction center subunit H [Chlorella sorokiniana]|uniref:Photosystem reaction center subunit H n=1 Tax=Chlorella sorokiniana TaxID=3076 RepID=A0A2P6U201_CHLSO|nr:photosystem reaction center subunit H [Chlorella sorokiniana]|eukprot:PRW60334.1 photosystem reaction center subunit H [Chlorella sorokiniana]
MQPAAGAAAVGQPRLASAARRRRGQQRHLVARVVSRYAAGAGGVPPAAAAAPPPLPPAQQQMAVQRPPVAPRRRVGVNVPPPTPVAPPGSSTLQSLTAAAGAAAGSAASSLAPTPAQQPFTVNVQQAAALTSPAEVLLSRSQVMGKEVITRTSGRRLGYVQQMFVDPGTLSVVSLYLRRAANPIGAKNGDEHILLTSLRQISDVILVHNEDALLDPTADDTVGFYPVVGSEVVTQDGKELGKVRDFVFDPDTGGIGTLKYDKLGVPSIPQQLLDCYSVSFSDIVAVGPTRVIVRAGTAQRAIKENDGILDSFSSAASSALAGWVFGGAEGEEKRQAAAKGDVSFRADAGYVQWYEQYGRASGAEPPGTPEYAAEQLEWKRARGMAGAAAAPPPPARQQAPPALPPPQTATFAQAVQPQQAQQASYQQAYQQQMFQQQRQAVPAGAAGGGWGAPPPAQQQAAAPPPYQQAYQAPPAAQQPYQAPPPQQPPAYQQPAAAAGPAAQAPFAQQQQQQYRPPAAAQQPLRPTAATPAPPAAAQQQRPIPQNGIPIIDRTPLPPYRRRDADGNYGNPPAAAAPPQQQQAPAQQQPLTPQRPAQPAPQRQPPPSASASWGGSAAAQQAQRAPQQPARMQQQAPVVVPDAVIIPGSVQRPTGGLGNGGAVGGPTRIAEYRQL